MALSNQQKKYIRKKGKLYSAKKLSEELNVSQKEIDSYIQTLETKKYPLWFYAVLILLPFAMLLLLETTLRLTNYGNPYDQWIQVEENQMMLNPDIAYRYFYNTQGIPYASKDLFNTLKSENSIRVFIIGGSTAAGFPYAPSGTFSKYIRKRLELIYPQNHIEVVNISMAAINSYALRDLLPGILEQKPDILLMYAGHNEYYGALGVGSVESLGNSRFLVNSLLWLNRFKTTEFLRDIIKSVLTLFSPPDKKGGTLMARMAEDQLIEYNSDVFLSGISQFEGNLRDMFSMIKDSGTKIIIGSLTSNLRNQAPFISVKSPDYPPAQEVFTLAGTELSSGNNIKADSLFRISKDLDALRFRAPEKINEAIFSLAKEFKFPVLNIDSVFNKLSPGKIVGNNLMTDHLHPNLEGYQIMGRLFMEKIIGENLITKTPQSDFSFHKQDSLVLADYNFTRLDSTIARYRIIILKSDWPYVSRPRTVQETLIILNRQNFLDSLALRVVDNKLAWEKAHRDLAMYYLKQNNVKGFLNEMDVLIDQFPNIDDYYRIISNELMRKNDYSTAFKYLSAAYELFPDSYFSKWLGIIYLNNKDIEKALKYLKESINMNGTDAQSFYNLAGAYLLNKNYREALNSVTRCLQINPGFPEAKNLQNQLLAITQK